MNTLDNIHQYIQPIANIIGGIGLIIITMITGFKIIANDKTNLVIKIKSLFSNLTVGIFGYMFIVMSVPFAAMMTANMVEIHALILVLIGFLMIILNYLINRLE